MKTTETSAFGRRHLRLHPQTSHRGRAIEVDVSTTAHEAGIKYPIFLTRAVFDAYVAVPPDVKCQDEAGRLWDIVWMTRFGILRARPGVDRISVALYVRNDNRAARLIKLIAICDPLDIDDPQPAITVMLPNEA